MKIVGIIAEYNPFHKGHEFHIEKAKMCIRDRYITVEIRLFKLGYRVGYILENTALSRG